MSFKHLLAFALLALAAVANGQLAQSQDPTEKPAHCAKRRSVRKVIEYILESEGVLNYTNVGMVVKVWNERSGAFKTLYERNSETRFTPASNMKLFTAAAAFFSVPLHNTSQLHTTVERSTDLGSKHLCVRFGGDYRFNSTTLQGLVRDAIVALNSTSNGAIPQFESLTVDDTRWDASVGGRRPFDSSWEWGDLPYSYAAQPSPAVYNGNKVGVQVVGETEGEPPLVHIMDGSNEGETISIHNEAVVGPVVLNSSIHQKFVMGYQWGHPTLPSGTLHLSGVRALNSTATYTRTVPHPGRAAAYAARTQFALHGVNIPHVSTGKCPVESFEVIATDEGPTPYEALEYGLEYSSNIVAEQFLRLLGDRNGRPSDQFADAWGKQEVRRILDEFGVDTNQFVQRDGSGLSRYNLATPEAIAQVLEYAFRNESFEQFRDLLPQPGQGTLWNRFLGTEAEHVLWAKTGSMTGANALSGFIIRDEFKPVMFSLIQNGGAEANWKVRPALDKIIVQLAKLKKCGRWSRFFDPTPYGGEDQHYVLDDEDEDE